MAVDYQKAPRVIGAGGGKSGAGGGGIQEDPDTLSSVATARFVDLIGEGPIEGLVYGAHSIYLDGTPLRTLEGTPNYAPFTFNDTSRGTPDQGVLDGFVGTQQETQVGIKIPKYTDTINNVEFSLVREVTDPDADAVRFTVAVNGLTVTDSSGKISGTSVDLELLMRVKGTSTWVVVQSDTITGKTRARTQKSYEVSLAGWAAGPYEIRVKRITADSASSLLVNDLYWDSFTVMNYERFTYPNSALVALSVDARYFSNVPRRAYHVRGLKVRVPANCTLASSGEVIRYETSGPGTTNGVWDGTFKIAYTNNPVWCFLDLLTNKRYGLGSRLAWEDDTDSFGNTVPPCVNKWELYEIARYCDERVPTGILGNNVSYVLKGQGASSSGGVLANVPVTSGPTEPRFTLNCVINTREDAFRVVNQLASVFRGMAYWSSGAISLAQDSPKSPSMPFNNASVIGGNFNYGGSSRTDRHTAALVGWNDPSEDFKQKFEYVEDRQGVLRYGLRQTEIVAFGTTSRSQARRAGLHLLYTERLEKDVITFRAGLNCAGLLPGHVVQIADSHRMPTRMAGRLVSATVSEVALDAAVTLAAGSYNLSVIDSSGTFVTRAVTIAAPGDYTTLAVGTAFSSAPPTNAVWTLVPNSVSPFLARVISIKEDGRSQFTISCLEYNESKYGAIDLGGSVTLSNYNFLSLSSIPIVTDLTAVEFTNQPTPADAVGTGLLVSWKASDNPLVRGYVVRVTANGETIDYPETSRNSLTLPSVYAGPYTLKVFTVNHLGTKSTEYAVLDMVVIGKTGSIANVSGFTATVTDEGIELSWSRPSESQWGGIRLKVGGTNWDTAEAFFEGRTTKHVVAHKVAGTYVFRAKHTVVGGSESSAEVTSTVVVSVPTSVTGLSVETMKGTALVKWTAGSGRTTQPVGYYRVKMGAQGTSFASSAEVSRTPGTSTSQAMVIRTNGTKVVWVQPVDTAGNVGTAVSLDFLVNTEVGTDTDPAPALSGFTATAGFGSVWLQWTEPSHSVGGGHGGVNIYRADWNSDGSQPVFSAAKRVGQVFAGTPNFIDPIGVGKKAVYWVKSFTRAGYEQTNPTPAGAGTVTQTTKIGSTDLGPLAVEAGNLANGSVDIDKLGEGAVDATKFASGVEPVSIPSGGSLPTAKITSVILWNGKLYRWNGSAYVANVSTADLTGTISNSQIGPGAVTDSSLAAGAVKAEKLALRKHIIS